MKKSIVISLLTFTILIGTALCSFASTGIVTTDTLRLREEASTNASIIGLLSMDDKVEVLEENNGWYRVKVGDKVGYVSAEYLKVEEIEPTDNEVEEESNNTNEETEVTNDNKEKVMVKVISAGVKVYMTPVINSIVIRTATAEQKINVISEVNGWSYVKIGDIKGWIREEDIIEREASETEKINTSSLKTGYISASSVNFREEAKTSSRIISSLVRNTEVKVIETVNGWTKVYYNGNIGYVSAQYVSNKKVQTTSRSGSAMNSKAKANTAVTNAPDQKLQTSNATGAELIAYAKKYLGYKYVYGGSTPSEGFDCSGFVQYVYNHFGLSVSRTSTQQAKNGKAVSRENLKPGDIICFSGSSGSKKITHSGIYIGNGQFIHAANSRKGVIISNVSGAGFYFVCARRIFE